MSGHVLIVVDMIKDNVNTAGHGLMDSEARNIIPSILQMTQVFRRYGGRVVFACDSFMEGDFIFRGRMPPHAIRGTGGDMPIDELEMQPEDLYLPKRRMSAFYKTDLDQTLRTWGAHTVAVCGIVTNVCVLLTALDAVQNDFNSIIVSDACACHKPAIHETTLQLYDKFLLAPIFRVMTVSELTSELAAGDRLVSNSDSPSEKQFR
ncbi:MAG: cysteine hydrolase [Desulfomonile tiedjei]|nr:cysteine hydrolase [Desulfomonile tiedjei]